MEVETYDVDLNGGLEKDGTSINYAGTKIWQRNRIRSTFV